MANGKKEGTTIYKTKAKLNSYYNLQLKLI